MLAVCEGHRVVLVAGTPVFRYPMDDRQSERLFVAQALENRWVRAVDLAAGLGLDRVTLYRASRRFREGGTAALAARKPGPKGPRLSPAHEAAIQRMVASGSSVRAVARRLGLSTRPVRAALRRLEQRTAPPANPAAIVLAPAAPQSGTAMLSRPPFLAGNVSAADARDSVAGGLWLVLAPVVNSGVFASLEQAFGADPRLAGRARDTVAFLLAMLAARVARPWDPADGIPGAVATMLGLPGIPARAALCDLIRELRAADPDERFLADLALRRVEARSDALGFLLAGARLSVYPSEWSPDDEMFARQRMSVPPEVHAWAVPDDEALFVVSRPIDATTRGLLPAILPHVKACTEGRRTTVVFARGGCDEALFSLLGEAGLEIVTFQCTAGGGGPGDRPRRRVATPSSSVSEGEFRLGSSGLRMRQVNVETHGVTVRILTTGTHRVMPDLVARAGWGWDVTGYCRFLETPNVLDALAEGCSGDCPGTAAACTRIRETLKMVAHQAEADLASLLWPGVSTDPSQARHLVTALLQRKATVRTTPGELAVSFAPGDRRAEDRALAVVLAALDATHTLLPGTRLRIRYKMAEGSPER